MGLPAGMQHFVYEPRDAAPRAYGTVKLALLGGPTTPGDSDQGDLYLEDQTFDGAGRPSTHGVRATTGPDTSDHRSTAPSVPFDSTTNLNQGPDVHGFEWTFVTDDGARYDVASFIATYTFLTPR